MRSTVKPHPQPRRRAVGGQDQPTEGLDVPDRMRFGLRQIAAGTLQSGIIKHYHNREYGHDYTIELCRQSNGTYKLWANESPHNPYGGGASTHHLYESGEICVEAHSTPTTLERAIAIAVYWMNRYSVYVETGHFPKTSGHVNV